MESRVTAMTGEEGRLGGGGIKQKGERTLEHGQQCGDCGGGGGGGEYKGTNGNGKSTMKREQSLR